MFDLRHSLLVYTRCGDAYGNNLRPREWKYQEAMRYMHGAIMSQGVPIDKQCVDKHN